MREMSFRQWMVFFLAVCLGSGAALRAHALGAGTKAPNIELKDLSGKAFKLSGLAGKVVLVDFWASWCAPCKQELPVLEGLYKKYRDRGLEIVAVSQDEDPQNASKFLKRAPLSFTVVHDAKRAVASAYAPEKMPSSFLIDRKGLVRYVHGGFKASDAAALEREIVSLLEAK
jgi:peroxiredoxin